MSQEKDSSNSIMFVVIAIAIVLMVAVVPFSMKGKGGAPATGSEDADARIQPVAQVAFQKAAPAAASGAPRDGATVYNSVCMACHASGAAGAPKAGDKAAWAPRLGKGTAELVKSVVGGKGAMPPKGGGADLSEDEIKAAVEHLLGTVK